MDQNITSAARVIASANAFVITAGAGMSVDSGLPDFRGDEGFWKAYPPFRKLGLSFSALANPRWFEEDPALAWGFYGHRLNLYRSTRPHDGFNVLRRFTEAAEHGSFVFTSNVDGSFQKASFDPERIVECHGSIHHAQCSQGCRSGVFQMLADDIDVDETTFRARGNLPKCRSCGAVLRPNILMFNDVYWNDSRTADQHVAFKDWMTNVTTRGGRVAIIELGAGTAIPTVRATSESLARKTGGTLIRINPREDQGPSGTIQLRFGARAALEALGDALKNL